MDRLEPLDLNGYTDLDKVASDLAREGRLPVSVKERQIKGIVALVLENLLRRIVERQPQDEQAWEFWCACTDIVQCAEKDGLL